jgi:hypothetical protein
LICPTANRDGSAPVIRAGTEQQSLDALADGRSRDLKPLGCGIEGDELDHRCGCGELLAKPVS